MFQEQLLEDLEEISKILDESFDATYGCYHDQNPLKSQGSSTTIINNNYGSSSYPFSGYSMPIYYPIPVSQTIIYDSSTKKTHNGSSSDNDEEESKKQNHFHVVRWWLEQVGLVWYCLDPRIFCHKMNI